jgi:hypothetical protein
MMLVEELALVAGTKQSRQAWLHCLPALSTCLLALFCACHLPMLLKSILAVATISTNKTKQGSTKPSFQYIAC